VWILIAQGLKDTPGNNVPIIIIPLQPPKKFLPSDHVLCPGFVPNVNH
jgi:hypothetical protein